MGISLDLNHAPHVGGEVARRYLLPTCCYNKICQFGSRLKYVLIMFITLISAIQPQ